MVDRPIQSTIIEMVSRIRRTVDPERIILFGSHARGDATSYSDLDLLIVAPSALPRWNRTVPIYRLLAGMGIGKDIVWWTPDEIAEWRGVPAHFINRIIAEGRVLYENPG